MTIFAPKPERATRDFIRWSQKLPLLSVVATHLALVLDLALEKENRPYVYKFPEREERWKHVTIKGKSSTLTILFDAVDSRVEARLEQGTASITIIVHTDETSKTGLGWGCSADGGIAMNGPIGVPYRRIKEVDGHHDSFFLLDKAFDIMLAYFLADGAP